MISPRGPTPINREVRAVHHTGFITCQINNGMCNIFWCGQLTLGDSTQHKIKKIRILKAFTGQVCFHKSGCHRIDRDSMFGPFNSQCPDEVDNATLGRAVDRLAGYTDEA